jgi:DNA-binding transcriptional MocR family regulator
LANHEDKKTLFDGKPLVVKRGQRITSVRQLAERWHWGNDRTLKYLRMLESEKMIVKESDKRRTLITIVNYGVYNDMPNTDKNTDRTLTSTESEHCPNTDPSQTTMNNNDNNENNETNNTPLNPPKGKREKKESNVTLLKRVLEENPSALSADVIAVLHEWMEYKDQRKDHYQERGLQTVLNQVYKAQREYGSEAVIDCIRNSMASNYQGMILDSLKKTIPHKQVSTGQQSSLSDWAERMKRERGEQ